MQYYSQYKQDRYIYKRFFKNLTSGFFLDIGAHDGILLSNTCFFENTLGWSGICVEPIPSVFKQLVQNRPKSIHINGCIAEKSGQSTFWQISGYSEMLSGLVDEYDPAHTARIRKEIESKGGTIEERQIPCYRLADLLAEHGVDQVDYCSIDVEGAEMSVLRSIDFDKVKISVFSIENNYNTNDIRKFMRSKGYSLVVKLECDEIYTFKKRSIFDYIKDLFGLPK